MLKTLYDKKLNAFLILFLSNALLMIINIVFNFSFSPYVQLKQDLIFILKESIYSFALFGFVFYAFTLMVKITPPHIIGGGILLLLSYNFLCFFCDIFLLFNFQTFTNPHILDPLLKTNLKESLEFIATFFTFKYIFMILVFVYINILLLRANIKLNKKLKIILNTILVIVFIILIANLRKNYKSDNIEDKYRILNGITHTRMMVSFVNYYKLGLNSSNDIIDFFKQKDQSLYKQKPKENIKNIILIIGESFAKNKSSLYGGYLNTNPMLKNLSNSGNLVLFTNTIAPAYATDLVMRSLLNFSNYENTTSQNNWYKHLDIITLFNKYGYKTFFISNQESTKDSTAFLTSINSSYVHFENKFANPIKAVEKSKPDEVLFDKIKNLDLSKNNFIIIHLMGSHARYENRYTKDFDKFKQDDIKDKKEHKKLLASYYNSVLYNDFVINSIFDIFSDDDSVILYLSDHGEALYDDKKGITLTHGIVDKSIADIPFMVIFTNTFKNLHKNLVDKIITSSKKPYMSDDLIHTICDLAGIYPDDFDEKRSVINDNFNIHRKRMFMGVDYELLK